MSSHPLIDYSISVSEARKNGEPVVALESTIIAHGMPYPKNMETARQLENIIRDEGAIPATIAILNGRIKVGLSEDQLHLLATSPDIIKASRRDMGFLISQKKHAATTVAATMMCANLAGIKIFATGGIGGVHRDAQQTFDISADLQELANTPVAVVSAGVKAILDIPLTLEYLETMGVAVVSFGTDEFPAFYTRSSGIKSPYRLDDADAIAHMLHTHWYLGARQGVLIANPIPEAFSMNPEVIQKAIDMALEEAKNKGIGGKAVTPFLLARITELTRGDSLFSNIKLVANNAQIAARVALALNNHAF